MTELAVQFLVSVPGILGFSVLFNVPRRQMLPCVLAGSTVWLIFLLVRAGSGSAHAAAFVSALALMAASRALSAARETPTTVFLIPGIFPTVPGAGIYYTAYYFFTNDYAMAAAAGVDTLKAAGAIALGILFGFAIPGAMFTRLFARHRAS